MRGFAFIERINSSCTGCTWTRPRVTFTNIGKNTMITVTSTLGVRLVMLNMLLSSGVRAMMGTAASPAASGVTRLLTTMKRWASSAATIASIVPKSEPEERGASGVDWWPPT